MHSNHIHWVLCLCCDSVMVLNVLVRVALLMSPLLTMNFLCYSICCYFYYLSFLLYCYCYCYCHHHHRPIHSVDQCLNYSMNCLYLFGLYFDWSTVTVHLFVLRQTETVAVLMTSTTMMKTILMYCWLHRLHLFFVAMIYANHHFVMIAFDPDLMVEHSSLAKNIQKMENEFNTGKM